MIISNANLPAKLFGPTLCSIDDSKSDSMTLSSAPVDTVSDRVKLPLTFDVAKMQAEIESLNLHDFTYYDSIPLRAPAHVMDPSRPFPPPADDYADGSWTEWLDSKILQSTPYLLSIIDHFREHTKVTLVRILRLEPGAIVKEHTDPTLGLQIERSVIRLTIPVSVNEKVDFFLNNNPVPMQPGECWYLRLTDPHKVDNAGDTVRTNITLDMIPNEWVTSLILDNQ